MATNAAAMPQPVRKNCRRLRPSRLALASASSLMRASTLFCLLLCRGGRYSPLETIWVGIGVAAEAVSAPATRRCSRSLSQIPMGFLRSCFEIVQCRPQRALRAVGYDNDGLEARLRRSSDLKSAMPYRPAARRASFLPSQDEA